MFTCDSGNYTSVWQGKYFNSEIYVSKCEEPAVLKYEGSDGDVSWVGYRCQKHSTLSDTLKITWFNK